MIPTLVEKKHPSLHKKQREPLQAFYHKRNTAIQFLEQGDELFKKGEIDKANEFYRQAWALLRSL